MTETQAAADKPPKQRRLPLFESILPLNRSAVTANLAAGVSLAAMNIPQAMGYARIAGTPVITGLYTLLLPLVAFAALGSSRATLWWRLIQPQRPFWRGAVRAGYGWQRRLRLVGGVGGPSDRWVLAAGTFAQARL